jgi:sulfatase maturation enzyme AslB (radical SAM superfamily)
MNSKRSKEEILFKTVKENNILPITSICKLNCIFCSHKNNPSEIETYSFGHLEFDLIKKMIEFLDPEQPVFIGESASKIIEGEPFVHPDIYKILNYIRQRWPEIEIKITSSGSFLQPEKVDLLKKLEPLELNISLNGPAPEERVFLMNDTRPDNVFKLIPELKKQRIKFDSSIVSMHHLKGCNYLKRTFDFLEKYPPQSLRVFFAGFSGFADEDLIIEKSEYYKLNNFIKQQQKYYSFPIIIEPQLISSLEAEINNLITNSAAQAAGLKSGDIILKINKIDVKSRVDAFYKIKAAKNPEIEFIRKNKKLKTRMLKEENKDSGLIMSYDLTLNQINKLTAYAEASKKDKNTAVIASIPAYKFIKKMLKPYLNQDFNLTILKANNLFFGGSIFAAGLLCNSDLIQTLRTADIKVDRIILPEIIYDYYGNDLLGNHYSELEDEFEAEIVLI